MIAVTAGAPAGGASTRQLSLAHLTVLDSTPPELVAVAAAAGFRTIGIRLTATDGLRQSQALALLLLEDAAEDLA